ncbi:hypothetical protein [Mesorhizobium sp. B2-8-3]|uniref:hypothetical protein n=1 Tax=Mesorhizobium sp. B2-8-3 TaxID=2589905 RepID=UPI00112688A0|nr:hypothetical protein [Mesorhizobium sp. B2-8-3]TPJ33671.1 hypothetical protein FJ418_13660 [Mesorhizobium sp. B2-8-3]
MAENAEYTSPETPFSISMDADSGDLVRKPKDAVAFDSDDLPADEENDDVRTDGTTDGADGDEAEGADEEGAAEDDGEGGEEDLGAFDPEDADSVAKFDAKYLKEDGFLDLDGVLTQEFWANQEAGKEGLNDDTYAYLEARGISKAQVKQIEAMAQTQKASDAEGVVKSDNKLFEVAGGADKLQAALKWGKDGGYTQEQQDRFNKITKGKDQAAKEEAVLALMARFEKANPVTKPKLPLRDGTKGQGQKAPSVKPFKDRQEMKEVRDAIKQGDTKAWALYNARRSASKF